MHDYHDALPDYSPDQILHDGCSECEARGATPHRAISSLDRNNFHRAWERALQWNYQGLSDLSYAEIPLLKTLWAVHLQQNPGA